MRGGMFWRFIRGDCGLAGIGFGRVGDVYVLCLCIDFGRIWMDMEWQLKVRRFSRRRIISWSE